MRDADFTNGEAIKVICNNADGILFDVPAALPLWAQKELLVFMGEERHELHDDSNVSIQFSMSPECFDVSVDGHIWRTICGEPADDEPDGAA